jgi:hypothetical protein
MANLTFPSNPVNGQKVVIGTRMFEYNSTKGRWSTTVFQVLGDTAIAVPNQAPTINVSSSSISLDTTGANVLFTYQVADVDSSALKVSHTVNGVTNSSYATVYHHKANNTVTIQAGTEEFSSANVVLTVTDGRNNASVSIDVSAAYAWIMDIATFTHNPTSSTRTKKLSSAILATGQYNLTGNADNSKLWHFKHDRSGAVQITSGSNPPNVMNFSSLTTTTYNFSIDGAPLGIEWSNDGTIFYVLTDGNYINQYSVSTPFDLSTFNATYTQRFQVESQSRDLHFSPDGTKVYYAPNADNLGISQRTLSTPWDISSAGSLTTLNIADSRATGVSLNPNGEYLYTIGWTNIVNNGANLRRFVLSTPFNISTATQDQVLNVSFANLGNEGVFCLSMHNKLMPVSISPSGKLFRWGL